MISVDNSIAILVDERYENSLHAIVFRADLSTKPTSSLFIMIFGGYSFCLDLRRKAEKGI